MLKHTFLHLPSIGATKERALWQSGILTWDDFERHFFSQANLFPSETESVLSRALFESRKALERDDLDYFADRLPKQEHYRIALSDPTRVLFLDIETTGLSLYYDQTTIIGASDSAGYYLHIRGHDIEPVSSSLERASCIVTFNGTAFDLKFLQKEFPNLRIPRAHVDLRYFGRSVGLKGPQKTIERELKLTRPEEIRDVIGETAPLLWYRYSLGDEDSARKLIEYNFSDIEGMKFIFDTALDRCLARDPIFARICEHPRFFSGQSEVRWAKTPATQRHDRVYIPPFRGKIGPKVTYQELVSDTRSKRLRVVGIDLTGSAKRPTGWCLLVGSVATTKLLRKDKDLIEATVAARPDIVSIDSPLSLPKGRKSVHDTDPGRDKFGIMRECERTLKKRGVNVYPSLINSMQQLTARGIRLAKELRSRGLPVIESYPGAAQDIMGIPRKRAGLEYLKGGLAAFGISGEFLRMKVSHDEVDAVTSAAVGLFFWSGKFEALGNEEEEFLIVPDLEVRPGPWRRRVVIGTSGSIASGKTTGAKCLERLGYAYGRYSQVLADLLAARGQRPTRRALQVYGEQIHKKPGQRWLCRQLVLRLPRERDLAIDGLRFPEDHAFLVESFGPAFCHIHVLASEKIRRRRYIKDGGSARAFDRAIRQAVEAGIPRLKSLAHREIDNEGTRETYQAELSRVAKRLVHRGMRVLSESHRA